MDRIAIGGASAGSGRAAALGLLARWWKAGNEICYPVTLDVVLSHQDGGLLASGAATVAPRIPHVGDPHVRSLKGLRP